MSSFCSQCGTTLEINGRFCEACGTPVSTQSTTNSAPPPSQGFQFTTATQKSQEEQLQRQPVVSSLGLQTNLTNQWDSPSTVNIVYGLQAAGVLFSYVGIGFIVTVAAAIVASIGRSRTSDWRLASHYRWQLRTCVFELIWGIVAAILILTIVGAVIGVPLAIAVFIWSIYRIVKGFIDLRDLRPMYPAQA